MSGQSEQPGSTAQEQADEKHRLLLPRLSAFTPDQAQELAQMQVQRVVVFTGNFLTTTITVLTTALGLVAGLAWNKLMLDWLQTVNLFGLKDLVSKDLAYAIGVTVLAVIFIFFVSFVNRRNDWLQRRLDTERTRS